MSVRLFSQNKLKNGKKENQNNAGLNKFWVAQRKKPDLLYSLFANILDSGLGKEASVLLSANY